MAKRGGFPGGMPGNMNNLMKQAQRMQRQMEEGQKELETKEFSASAGGGAVEYFPISCGSGTYKVQIYEQTEGDKYAKSLETEFSVKLRS